MSGVKRYDHLTQERLLALLDYDQRTGLFTRKARSSNAMPGTVAGSVSKSQGYVEIRIDNKLYLAHRLAFLAMTGEWPSGEVDHENGDRSDNRWENLRNVDRSGNNRNHSLSSRNKSGIPGVRWRDDAQKWEVRISAGNDRRNLGLFAGKFEAACVRKSAEVEMHFNLNHGRIARVASYAELEQERDALVQRCRELEGDQAEQASLLEEAIEQRDFLDKLQSDEGFRREKAEAERDTLRAEVEQLRSLLSECADYLNINELTSISHGSILHRKMMEASQCATTTGDTTTA